MILSFGDKATENLFHRIPLTKVPADVQERAFARLVLIDAAESVLLLRVPPSNRLEALHGKLRGFWSIRVNTRWRIIFRFENGNAYDVEFIDYH